jgi:hypothetical protein
LGLDGLGLTRLALEHRQVVEGFLDAAQVPLACASFPYLTMWSGALNMLWQPVGEALLLFAGTEGDYFLFLPPLAPRRGVEGAVLGAARETLRALNGRSTAPLRIDHVPQAWAGPLQAAGLRTTPGDVEYLYARADLAALRGAAYKSHRGSLNQFVRNHPDYRVRPFSAPDTPACLDLYRRWSAQKLREHRGDEYFRLLIEDAYFAQKRALFHAEALAIEGVVLILDNTVQGYSLGFQRGDTLVNLFEAADPSLPGAAALLFRELARRVPTTYINTLDDSGLPGLRAAKQAYRPLRTLPRFSAFW